jgi:hypothetical protein
MKRIPALLFLVLCAYYSHAQTAPKPYDPCEKLDTNNIKQLILGSWVDVNDTSHTLYITTDSLVEKVIITMGNVPKTDISDFSYKFIDNLFSTDAVTCYSIREYKDGESHHTDIGINGIDNNFLMLGSTGKMVFKRK